MYCIFWKNKVGQSVAALCDYLKISYEIVDDSDNITSFEKYEVIIPSPWVPWTHPIYGTGKVLAELDFAHWFLSKGFQIISVTGTDGKSTTAWIAYNILQKEFFGKKNVYLSGNFDIPFSTTVLDLMKRWEKRWIIVLEVSSFMAHAIKIFQPTYTLFTNLKQDHLNWHRNIQEYLDAKMNLVKNTTKKSIINKQLLNFAEDQKLQLHLPENVRIFSDLDSRDSTDGEDIIISWRKKYKLSETQFSWFHNAMNLLSVWILASEMKICSKRMKKYFSEITGLPHRLEKIGEKNGIIFIEDSKSTSSQSLEAALWSFWQKKNLLLIVWGSDKWDTFSHLAPKFHERVKAIACIGATKEQFVTLAKQENIPYSASDILSDTVEWLYKQGTIGDILILSPGCASFGLFKDYLDRANSFREAIKNLP